MYVWDPTKIWDSEKWPTQEAFIPFKQRNDTFVKNWQDEGLRLWIVNGEAITRFVHEDFSALNSLCLVIKMSSMPPGMGRVPFSWKIHLLLSCRRRMDRVSLPHLLFLKYFSFKIISMPRWHIWKPLFPTIESRGQWTFNPHQALDFGDAL